MKKQAAIWLFVGALALGGCASGVTKGTDYSQNTKQSAPAPELEKKPVDTKEVEVVSDKVTYYPDTKTQKPAQTEVAVKIIKNTVKKNKGKIKEDPNDQNYRDYVSGLLGGAGDLSPKERQALLEYVKYLSAIEKRQINKKIEELLKKLKSGKGTKEDLALLQSLLPIKGGVPLKDKGKPTPNKKPGIVKLPDKAQDPSELKKTTKPNTPKPGDLNPGEKDKPNKPEDPKPTHPGNDHSGTEKPDTNGGNEPNQKNPIPGQGSSDGNGTPQQPGDNGKPNDKNKPDDNNKPGESQLNKPEPNGYNRAKAKEYAYKWWNKRNNAQYGYYSRAMGGCEDCWADCTNFISQVIKAGGMKEVTNGNSYWYYSDKKPSLSWGVAHSFYLHMKQRAKPVENIWDLKVGDIINFDFENDGRINHSAVVTRKMGNEVYVTQHTADKKDSPISWLLFTGAKLYGFDMSTAKN
ncbi:amidase domain-containing protein [Thermoflavimicrobium daqui]|uniref:amidase domain-containing protein n=1 Tax=Thermoflavimicrobium daqui TaxID=2137476 RepID=UPI00143DCFB4|nr:amidase domain-containing protein [Thermoflavimicrobium daqui]